MTYTVEFNALKGHYEMVLFQQLEGNVRLKTGFVNLKSVNYKDALVEAEIVEMQQDAPFTLDLDDLELEAMADYYAAGDQACEFDR